MIGRQVSCCLLISSFVFLCSVLISKSVSACGAPYGEGRFSLKNVFFGGAGLIS